jgi:hypothetical protein
VNDKDEKLWTYHGDHLRRWVVEHRKQLQHWSDDSKFEQRPVPSFAERRTAATDKFHQRMSTACHQIAMQIAGYANRRRFAQVRYDDTERGFVGEFPWQRLQDLIAEKLDALGIEYEHVVTVPEAPEEQSE